MLNRLLLDVEWNRSICQGDNLPTLMKISNHLSFKFLDRRRRRVAQITKERSSFPCFKDLLNLVEEENSPVNSPLKMLSEQRRSPPNKGTRVKASLNAVAEEDEPEKCPYCSKHHKLVDCLAFEKMDRSGRIMVMRRNRLCNNCFGKGHVSRRCKDAPVCKAPNCKYKHHNVTSLSTKRLYSA